MISQHTTPSISQTTNSVLVAEISNADPFTNGLVGKEEYNGPIISLLNSRSYAQLHIIRDVNYNENRYLSVISEVEKRFPGVKVTSESLSALDYSTSDATCNALQLIVDSIRNENPSAYIFVSLNADNNSTNVAWIRLVYRNSNLTLLQVRLNLHVSATTPHIDIVEESKLEVPKTQSLREPPEPMADELARNLELVGNHQAFLHLIDRAYTLSRFDASVLITGEPGSGKTSLAYFVWRASLRAKIPMQVADPSGLPDPLAASLLFGNHDTLKHSGSGSNIGKMLASGNGTLLIENVEKLSATIQDSITRYLKTGLLTPIGTHENIRSNVRLILTSGVDSSGSPDEIIPELRERLQPTTLCVPSLHDRREDIPLIALHYLRKINLSLKNARSMSHQMLHDLQQLPWHGNVSELRQAIERTALLSHGNEMSIASLYLENEQLRDLSLITNSQTPEISNGFSLETFLGDMRRKLILRALELSRGNQSEAARMLSITPQAVHQFLKFQNKVKNKPEK